MLLYLLLKENCICFHQLKQKSNKFYRSFVALFSLSFLYLLKNRFFIFYFDHFNPCIESSLVITDENALKQNISLNNQSSVCVCVCVRLCYSSPDCEMTMGNFGLLFGPVGTFSIFRMINKPSRTRPNTTCLLSRKLHLAHVMKN